MFLMLQICLKRKFRRMAALHHPLILIVSRPWIQNPQEEPVGTN
uniref:Uncharacterized protein n=1 Tax=Arundo donax TaxID=35708 RepID=A0A0A8ZXF7_ARUDO